MSIVRVPSEARFNEQKRLPSVLLPFLRLALRSTVMQGASSEWAREKMTAKNRITVNLDDAEYEALQRMAEHSERSLAWLGRRAISEFIEQRERDEAPLLATVLKMPTEQRTS